MIVASRFIAHFARLTHLASKKSFVLDERGTTAVEFAMISVPFLGLIGAIFETGTIYFRTAQLQMATETASRSVLTHSTAAGLTYKQFIDQNVCTWQTSGSVKPGTLSRMFDCSKIMVDIRSPLTWGVADTGNNFYNSPNPTSAVITMPAPGQIAIVRIAYPMTAIASILGGSVFAGTTFGPIRSGQVQYNSAWTTMLMGIAAFRVEP